MNSQTLLTRVVSKSLQIFLSISLLILSGGAAIAQNFWADWTTSGNALVHNFTLPDGTTGTVTRANFLCSNPSPVFSVMFPRSISHVPAQNYPSTFFTPAPPNPVETLGIGIDRDILINPGCTSSVLVSSFAFTFSETVANIRLHFINVEAGTYRFFDALNNPLNPVRLNGNLEFEVVGNVVNATPRLANNNNCEDNLGGNPEGGCGTIVIPGKYTQFAFTAEDLGDAAGSGDGFDITTSLFADYGDAPTSYDNNGVGEASHDLLAGNLQFGASVDADTAEKSGVTALGDDSTGSDDENGVTLPFGTYQPLGGQICTGTIGTYTTLPNEYCAVISATNTGATEGQVVGWIDANGDGDFLDAVDRSVPHTVDDGTFATGNIPAGVTRNIILLWTGLPSTLPNSTYFRFRITRDATFFTPAPPPTGAAIDGEVEDYVFLSPSAANVSISGRVLTAEGRGIRSTAVILTDSLGNSRTAVTSSFGYYRFDEVAAGETYVLSVSSKRYQFEPRTVNVNDNLTDVDFVAQE
jgi:hypothetical protein